MLINRRSLPHNTCSNLSFVPGMAAKGGSVRDSILNFNVGVLGHIDSGKTALGETGFINLSNKLVDH